MKRLVPAGVNAVLALLAISASLVATPAAAKPADSTTSPSTTAGGDSPTGGVTAAYATAACVGGGPTTQDTSLASYLNTKLSGTLDGYMTAYRVSCARKVVQAVQARGLDQRAAVIAVTTTIVESTIQNVAEEVDHDSLGLFQQRASWGSRSQRLDPTWATNAFLNKMVSIYPNNSWLSKPIGEVCQAVQVSAYPDRYQGQAADAKIIVEAIWPPVASVYGALSDGRLTYSSVEGDSGRRLKTVTSTAKLGFTPVAMATLNFNTILFTSSAGDLYRVDVITNNTSLSYNAPVKIKSGGWTHTNLSFDGAGNLYGLNSAGHLLRYDVTAAKPAAGNVVNGTDIGGGFVLKTFTTAGPDWILATAADGRLLSYKINGVGSWSPGELKSSTWQGMTHLMSPGAGIYYGRTSNGALHRYLDRDPYDRSGADLYGQGTVDDSGWTQTLLSAHLSGR
ncbi:tachylectin-related carbohydrate-binding protein [Plantactinospora sp. GCM10030261]|uniref:tachylectin-related carbohydrate-binding protein n=1 Tax=Plantactinospora sp. GCM10030261 TaxID=3273420 RepID=UPI00360CBE39